MKTLTLILLMLLIGCSIIDPEPEIREFSASKFYYTLDGDYARGYSTKWNENITINGQTRTLIYVKTIRITTEDGKFVKAQCIFDSGTTHFIDYESKYKYYWTER